MIITYNPSRDLSDTTELDRFYREYILPLGRGRKALKTHDHDVLIQADSPGMLTLAARFLEIAIGRLQSIELEEVEQWDYAGGWFGDLEPGSPIMDIKRKGPPLQLPGGFHYDVPPFDPDHTPSIDGKSRLEVRVARIEPNRRQVELVANAEGLIFLTRYLVYMSQAPAGGKVSYNKVPGLVASEINLTIEKAVFPENVPWAKIPKNP